ncbi:MAG TPA: ATP-binding protein, partial [Ktedonobacterales bacterium]
GKIIASPERERLLQFATPLLPGASAALAGHDAMVDATDASGKEWLYSTAPVSGVGWAVIAQRPVSDLASEMSDFRDWLAVAAGLFALGGLCFWLILMWRVVRPLHLLTEEHAAMAERYARHDRRERWRRNASVPTPVGPTTPLLRRVDEIGGLARTLSQLRWDLSIQLAELRTLLVTSNAVVRSLDPQKVGMDIIREVRRLLDVQAAAVLAPDERGGLRTLAWQGCEPITLTPTQVSRQGLTQPVARALLNGQPMQMVADGNPSFPERSYREGFRSVLALPILTERVGTVVLEVQRTQPVPFSENEINLLQTFANYAALAWEHAALYERTDERLRETAQENARLYEQANAERQTLSAIMGSMADGLLLASADGVALYANPGARALIALPEGDLSGVTIADIHAELAAMTAQPDRYRADMARALVSGERQWTLAMAPEHGDQVYTVRMFEVRDEEGEAIGQGLLLRDITREEEANEFKSALLAAVGHELRTPLAAIKGHASTLLQDDVTWPPDDQRHFLRTISDEADRMAQMISNLLDLSRLEAGLLLLRRTPYQLADLVGDATRRLRADEGAIAVDIAPDVPSVLVDGPRIEVVIHNLLANALAYGDAPVRLRARREGDGEALIEVIDSGAGIAAEDLPHVFERFYRASHRQSRGGAGAGLGLAICKAFVEAHGGRIWARNRNTGVGAVISFTLPLAPVVAPEATEQETTAQAPRGV